MEQDVEGNVAPNRREWFGSDAAATDLGSSGLGARRRDVDG